jgi:hypothetical protein
VIWITAEANSFRSGRDVLLHGLANEHPMTAEGKWKRANDRAARSRLAEYSVRPNSHNFAGPRTTFRQEALKPLTVRGLPLELAHSVIDHVEAHPPIQQ